MPDDATIIEGDAGFLGMASRLNPVQLQPGMCQLVENMRLDRGVAQTRKGALRVASGIAPDGRELTLPFALASDVAISTITFAGTTATVTTAAVHGYTSTPTVNIRGATGIDSSLYNGDFVIAVTSTTQFTYTMTGTPTANATGILIANKGPFLLGSYSGGVLASGIYSSPRFDFSNEYIVLVSESAAYLWREGASLVTLTYPGTDNGIFGDDITVLQAFDKLYIHRDRPTLQTRRPTSLTQTGPTATVTLTAHGFETNDVVRISNSTAAAHNADHVITKVNANSFTFTAVLAASNTVTITIAAPGVVTWNAHNLNNGQAIQLTTTGTLPTGLTAGTTYYIVAGTANTFQLAATVGGSPITTSGSQSGTHTAYAIPAPVPTGGNYVAPADPIFARRVLPTLVWDGNPSALTLTRVAQGVHPTGVSFSRMPAGPIAAYYNNQTIIVRGRDEILISDVLDAETYDPLQKSFRANVGSNDQLVAIHPYADGQALIFGKKSIYLATIVIDADGVSIDPTGSRLQLLTNEIGCVSRYSIATAGVFVFFLSESGVYRLDNQFDLKLRGNTQPLSDPISDLLESINQSAAYTSVGLFFNNRYYLAIPTGTSNEPDTIYAYNMLNQQWEYRDTFGFRIGNLLVSDYSGKRRLFATNRNGGLFLLDENEDGLDSTQDTNGTDYQGGRLITRRYSWGSLNAKRLLRVKSSLVLPDSAALAIDAVTTDFDRDFQIATLTNASGSTEDYTLKAPLRTKATYLDIRYRTTAGRPILRNITAESTRSNLEPTETRTLN
jgi:hypothetical protein